MVWYLSAGRLHTHLREEDGLVSATLVADSLEIVEGPSGGPVLFPNPPLARGSSRVPGHGDTIRFVDDASRSRFIELTTPGSLVAGLPRTFGESTYVSTSVGVDVRSVGVAVDELSRIAAEVEASISGVSG
jgi:hypothetical protein